jgi:hypothetical protein
VRTSPTTLATHFRARVIAIRLIWMHGTSPADKIRRAALATGTDRYWARQLAPDRVPVVGGDGAAREESAIDKPRGNGLSMDFQGLSSRWISPSTQVSRAPLKGRARGRSRFTCACDARTSVRMSITFLDPSDPRCGASTTSFIMNSPRAYP